MRNVKRQSLEIGYLQKQEIQGECHKQKGLIKAITRPGNREPFSFTRHRSGQHPKWPTTTNDRVSFRSICPLFETLWSLSSVVSVISDQLHMVRVILNGWNTCARCSGKSWWKIIQSGSEKSWNMAKAHFLWMEPKFYGGVKLSQCNDQFSVNSLKAFLGCSVGCIWVFGKRRGIEP